MSAEGWVLIITALFLFIILAQDATAVDVVKQLTSQMAGQAAKDGNVVSWILAVVVGALLAFFYYLIRQSESKDKMFMDYVKEMKDDNKEFQKEAIEALKDNSNAARESAHALVAKIDIHTEKVLDKIDTTAKDVIQTIHNKREPK